MHGEGGEDDLAAAKGLEYEQRGAGKGEGEVLTCCLSLASCWIAWRSRE